MNTMNKYAPSLAAPKATGGGGGGGTYSPQKSDPVTHSPARTPTNTPVKSTSSASSSTGYSPSRSTPTSSAPSSNASSSTSRTQYVREDTDPHTGASKEPVYIDAPPRCHKCGSEISGPAYEFQGNSYHETCWRCEGCNGGLNGIPFGLVEGKPWCKDCNFGRSKEYCPGCGKLISEGTFTKALGHVYHTDCFKCTRCNSKITQATGGFFEHEGKPICKACHHKK